MYSDATVKMLTDVMTRFEKENERLKEKLDSVREWATSEVMFTANTTGMAESKAYTRAQMQVLDILRG